jgi:hypothetical protein
MKLTVLMAVVVAIVATALVVQPASARPKGDNFMSLAQPSEGGIGPHNAGPAPDRPKRNDGPANPNPERPKRNDSPSNPLQWILDLITGTGYSK